MAYFPLNPTVSYQYKLNTDFDSLQCKAYENRVLPYQLSNRCAILVGDHFIALCLKTVNARKKEGIKDYFANNFQAMIFA